METLPATSGAPAWRAWLQLCRLANVFTAAADVLAGWYFVTAESFSPTLALLLAASACLYTAGMVLNDVFDVEVDRYERPKRPLPSGRISMAAARGFGWTLLVVGLLCGWAATTVTGLPGPGAVATLLALLVVGYDAWLKKTPLGPVAMGGCRALNILLGMSVAAAHWQAAHWLVAAGLGVYVAGFTIFARYEAATSGRTRLIAGLGVMAAGVALLAALPDWLPAEVPAQLESARWWLLLGLLFAVPAAHCLVAVVVPERDKVQLAVKQAIVSIIFLDAAVCVLARGVEPALAIIALVIPTVFLGRYFDST